MREWFKQSHNKLAIFVWGMGICCIFMAVTSPIGIAQRIQNPILLIGLVTAVVSLPVGWGIVKRREWAKWIVACILFAMLTVQLIWGIANRNVGIIGVQLLVLWGVIRLIRWDITGAVERERRMELLSEFLQQNAPQPVAPSSVTLEVSSLPPVTLERLMAAVESSFNRECKISSSNNNIDLGIEAACTKYETAVVGGSQSDRFGHLIVGARPIALEVVWSVVNSKGTQDSLPNSVLTIRTPRLTTRTVSNIDGYDWTIPLAAALWTSNTRSVTLDNEHLTFESAEELLAWKNARLAPGK